jgi:hypothetical protein
MLAIGMRAYAPTDPGHHMHLCACLQREVPRSQGRADVEKLVPGRLWIEAREMRHVHDTMLLRGSKHCHLQSHYHEAKDA